MAQHFFGLRNVPILFGLILHLGTASATVLVYYRPLWRVVRGLLLWPLRLRRKVVEPPMNQDVKLGLLLITATGVTGAMGILLRDTIGSFFQQPGMVPVFFAVTGIVLLGTRFLKQSVKGVERMGFSHAVVTGASQAVSMLPGVSRSGVTISTVLYLGFSRRFAGVFSFLLSIPSILGASLLELLLFSRHGESVMPASPPLLLMGFTVALITGYGALRLLLAFLQRGKLHLFSIYCFTAAACGAIFYTMSV
jgi:undecaprenyl-diphosphatase